MILHPLLLLTRIQRQYLVEFLNNKKVVEDLDMNIGTQDMKCNCSSSAFKYEPLGHVVTGNLSINKDSKLRQLIKKGPSYREQNNINWNVNAKICKEAVSKYKVKWEKRERVDKRVFGENSALLH